MHKNTSFAQKYTKSHKTSKRHSDDSETTESKGEQHLQVVLSENGFIPDLSFRKVRPNDNPGLCGRTLQAYEALISSTQ